MTTTLPKNAFFIGPIPEGAVKIFQKEGLAIPKDEWEFFRTRYNETYYDPSNQGLIGRLAHDFPHRVMLPYNALETQAGGTVWFLHPLASRDTLNNYAVLPCCDVKFEANGSNIDVVSVNYSQIAVAYRGTLLPIYLKPEQGETNPQEKRGLSRLFGSKPKQEASILTFPVTANGSSASFIGKDKTRPGEYLYTIETQGQKLGYRVRPLPPDVTLALFKEARACTGNPAEARRIARELARPSFLPSPSGTR